MDKKRLLKYAMLSGENVKPFSGEKCYLSTGALKYDQINNDELEIITYENRPSRANLIAEKGDIIFAKMAGTNKTHIIGDSSRNHILSTGFFALKPNAGTCPEFLFHYLMSEDFHKQKDKLATGATQKALTNKGLSEIELSDIGYCEQKIIAEYLSKTSALIEKRKAQMGKLDLLVKSQFIELFGDPVSNAKGFDFIPFVDFMEICVDIGSNGANKVVVQHLDMKSEEDYALLVRTVNFTANDFTKNVKYISEAGYNFFKKSQVYGGEIIFNKIGSAGINFIMPKLNRPVSLGLNQIMITLKNINTQYLYRYLNTSYGKHQINSRVQGAVTKSIQKTELKKIPIMYPSVILQNQYADFVQRVETQKTLLQQSLAKLELNYKSLMQKCFQGEIF